MTIARAAKAPRYQPTGGSTRFVVWLLVATMLVRLLGILANAHMYLVLAKIRREQQWDFAQLELTDAISRVVAFLSIGFVVTTAIAFLIWQFKSVRNLPALGISDGKFSPEWSVGAWFIPLLNLVHGYLIMAKLWRTSSIGPDRAWKSAPVSRLIPIWWLTCLASGLFAFLSPYPSQGLLPGHRDYAYQMQDTILLQTAADVGLIAGAYLMLRLVREIERRQRALHRTHIFD